MPTFFPCQIRAINLSLVLINNKTIYWNLVIITKLTLEDMLLSLASEDEHAAPVFCFHPWLGQRHILNVML